MKKYTTSKKCKSGGLLSMLCMFFALASPGSAPAQAKYNISDPGTLGGDNSIPFWITNTGNVIGISDTGQFDNFGNPIDHAFLWSKGVMHDLGTMGDINSVALGGNNQGVTVGNNSYNINHALLWYKGAVADLSTLVGLRISWAQQINNAQQIVGGSEAADGTSHTVLWNHGVIRDLGTFGAPNTNSFGNGINDHDQIVGESQSTDVSNPILGFPPFHAAMWNKGAILDLGAGPEEIGSAAFNINNESQVVGRFAPPDPIERAVAWSPGSWTPGRSP